MVVTPNFHFLGNCMEGIELYKKVFGAKVLCVLKNKDANPKDYTSDAKYSEYVYHAEIMIGETRIMMSDITENKQHTNPRLAIRFSTLEIKFSLDIFASASF
jgi:PhnB protein